MAKFLDKDGLTHFWSKIKTLLSGKADQTSLDQTNQALARVDSTVGSESGGLVKDLNDLATTVAGKADSGHTHDAATTSANGFMTKDMVTKLNGIATGANKTTVDTALSTTSTNPVQNKVITTNINALNTFMNTTVPSTYAKKTDISTAYKAKGSVSSVPNPAAEDYAVGDVLNVTAAFTTTTNFVEGSGKQYPAGTNIVVVDVNGAAKWDVLAGFVDLSSYATNSDISNLQGQIDDIEAVTGSIDSITTTEIDTMMNA